MKHVSWDTITVGQFQDVYNLSKEEGVDEMEKVERTIGVLYGLTPLQVEELDIKQFKDMANRCAFVMTEDIPGKPVKYICLKGRRYAINYKPSTLKHRQYVELMYFGKDPARNMHLIMASIVNPVTWYGRRLPNDVNQHPDIASDMQEARLMDVYHTCIFFCKLYVSLITDIKSFLIQSMMKEGKITYGQAEVLVQASITVTAGSIAQGRWQPTKV